MKQLIFLFLSLLTLPCTASPANRPLLIFSATDTLAIQPLIDAFTQAHPAVDVRYREFQTTDLFNTLTTLPSQQMPDLVISSAMDLQIRLVNDGYAQAFSSPNTQSLPVWANWRNEAFGFTYEPAVMVYNKRAFGDKPVPTTHEALTAALRADAAFYKNRVGTYDIRKSGVGYLFASQDEVSSSTNGRLKENLGRAMTKVYCCTSEILDAIANGSLVLGYNLLGSYALDRARQDPRIGVIMPEDYTLVMSRVAFITRAAHNPDAAKAFLDYLLSQQGQALMSQKSGLIAINPHIEGDLSVTNVQANNALKFLPIKLGPALMVYLDQIKRRRFLTEWENALLYDVTVP